MSEEYKIPDPPDVDFVVDGNGRRYGRINAYGEYWHSEALGAGRGTYAWHDLLFQRGPVRPVEVPK